MIRLAALADLTDLTPVTRTVRGREIAVVRCGSEVYAFDARCTHRDAPLVDGAVTRKRTVLCPWHLGTFRVTDGHVVAGAPTVALRTYPLVLREGSVYLADSAESAHGADEPERTA